MLHHESTLTGVFGNWRQGTVAWQLIWLPFFQVSHAHLDMLHNNVSLLCSLTQWGKKKRGMGAGKLRKFISFFSGKKVQDSSSKPGWNISIPDFLFLLFLACWMCLYKHFILSTCLQNDTNNTSLTETHWKFIKNREILKWKMQWKCWC